MTNRLPVNYAERSRGVIVGAAVGDALGWPQEIRSGIVGGQKARNIPPQPRFREWQRNSGNQFGRYQETVAAGEYSDDTQLLLATARSCLAGEQWLTRLTQLELPAWTLYARGAGRAVLAAGRAWAEGFPPYLSRPTSKRRGTDPVAAYFNAGANGVAMRIAPHVISTAATTPRQLLTRVVADGILTHGHPRALVGAAIHALALRHALLRQGTLEYGDLIQALLDDYSWQSADWLHDALPHDWQHVYNQVTSQPINKGWAATVAETVELLHIAHQSLARGALANDEQTLGALGCYDKTRNGSGTVTAAAAAYIATRAAARPLTGLLRAAFLPKADTDTLASMTASLLGAIHGTDWLGSLAVSVQDADYIRGIATELADTATRDRQQPQQSVLFHELEPFGHVDAREIERFRGAVFSSADVNTIPGCFLDGRRIELIGRLQLPAGATSQVNRVLLKTVDGQTLVLDRLSRYGSRRS